MKRLDISATEKSPKIIFDPENYLYEMEGNSRPENVRDFYYPIIDSLKSFFDQYTDRADIEAFNKKNFRFNFKLEYFNSSSAKFISDILVIIKNQIDKKLSLKVYWYFDDGDEDMKEVGEDFSEMISVPFNYIMVKR